jgi:hypothetical protein
MFMFSEVHNSAWWQLYIYSILSIIHANEGGKAGEKAGK